MLPGFRFLFAAIMLSMSLLIFGLGAAALLRAAHESFASNSTWRGAPEVTFAQRPETTLPVLATLRVEPVAEKLAEPAKVVAVPAEPEPAESASRDEVAALKPVETPPAEMAKPDIAPVDMGLAQNPPAPEAVPAAPAAAEAAITGETKTAAVTASDTSSDSSEPAIAQPEPVVPQPTPAVAASPAAAPAITAELNVTATKIATLGGPPVDIASVKTGRPERAKDDQSGVQKHVHARRIGHRRGLAARALLAAQQLQQQQAYPFAPPAAPTTTATTRQRRQ